VIHGDVHLTVANQALPPAQVVEMFRLLLQKLESEQQAHWRVSSRVISDSSSQRTIDQRFGKFLALVLRHKPSAASLEIDNHGWADVSTLINGVNAAGYRFTRDDLDEVVRTSRGHRGEARFSFSPDRRWIRANWGHSSSVSS
jgi:RNA:NAD 2'-phosphotransferase (TPT1/KptA family)